MPWCPKCKCEYVEGIKECADCKVLLTDELVTADASAVQPKNSQTDSLDTTSSIYDYAVDFEENQQAESVEPIHVYQNKKVKAEDFKSSAYTLFMVGVIGIIVLILLEAGVFPFKLVAPSKYFTYTVMGTMFVIFIISGVFSFKTSKKYEKEAITENDLTEEIKNWVLNNLTKEKISELAAISEVVPEEIKYFKYFEIIKNSIRNKFGEQDVSYLEAICEELYGIIFDDSNV